MQTLSVIYVNKLPNLVLDTNTAYSEHKSKLQTQSSYTTDRLYNDLRAGVHGCNAM